MPYRPYQERKRHEAERFQTARETLNTDIEAWDLSKTSLENIVKGVLNKHQYKTGSDRNRMFGKLMGEARRHPKYVAYQAVLKAQQEQQQQDDVDRAYARAQIHEEDFQQIVADYPRDAWDNTAG